MKWLLGVLCIAAGLWVGAAPVGAEASLELRPLQYVESLQKGERKQGMVDIHNPQPYKVDVRLSVQGFKQIDDKGNLAFYESEQLRDGIKLDLETAEIPAHKTLRLYFTADGAKLPAGDVFAVIFAEATPSDHAGTDTTVRLGSLLILTNQTPGARQAVIERLAIPWLQIGAGLGGQAIVKNTAPAGTAGGFFPRITLTTWPFGPELITDGPLVQNGNQRTVTFKQATDLFGIYRVRVTTGESYKDQWIFAVTGYWRWLSVVLVLAIGSTVFLLWRWLHRKKLAFR